MTYKLVYFPLRGRAELIRYIFAESGQDYEDVRLSEDMWLKYKPETPLGQLPVLIYNGEIICQSQAISRFLANKFGLYSNDNWEKAQMDSVVDTIGDVAFQWGLVLFQQDPVVKKNMLKDFKKLIFGVLEDFECRLKQEFIVGNQVSWADLAFLDMMKRLEMLDVNDVIRQFPNCVAHKERISKRPNIAKWIASRPDSFI